jgi:hypothetical protein
MILAIQGGGILLHDRPLRTPVIIKLIIISTTFAINVAIDFVIVFTTGLMLVGIFNNLVARLGACLLMLFFSTRE